MAINAALGIASALLPMIGGMFGGSSANSGFDSYKYSRWLQEHQYELNRKTRQTSFQDTRYDLEQAGYNPLLAVGQQSNGGTFGATLNTQDPRTERLQNALSSINAFSTAQLNSAQSYNQVQQGKLTNSQAYNLMTQSKMNSAQTSLTNLQSQAQQIQNLNLPARIKSEIRLNNSKAQAEMMNAESNQVSAEANKLNAQTNSAVGASQTWRNYNQSLGYSDSYHFGPSGISVSHTGNKNVSSPGYTEKKKKGYYRTEYIGGKPIQVYVLK